MVCVKFFPIFVGFIFCGNFSCSVSLKEKLHSFNNLTDTSSAETVPFAPTSYSTLRTTSNTDRKTTRMSSEESATDQPSLRNEQTESGTEETPQETVSESSSTSATSDAPDECEAKGACELGTFIALGECENCYCQCAPTSLNTFQWKKFCCATVPPSVFDPNASPNPNACDTCEHMELLGKCTNDENYCSGSNKPSFSFTWKSILLFMILANNDIISFSIHYIIRLRRHNDYCYMFKQQYSDDNLILYSAFDICTSDYFFCTLVTSTCLILIGLFICFTIILMLKFPFIALSLLLLDFFRYTFLKT